MVPLHAYSVPILTEDGDNNSNKIKGGREAIKTHEQT